MAQGTARCVQQELFSDQKLCECGCGGAAPLAKYTDKRTGTVAGQQLRYIRNHAHRGKVVSSETRAKLSAAVTGDKQGGWKGGGASYRALHGYLCAHYPKTGICVECGRPANRTEYALIHGRTYSRNRDDYQEMCRPCHVKYDLGGRPRPPEVMARTSAGLAAYWERQRENFTHTVLRGADAPSAKLTEAAVIAIRSKRAAGTSCAALATEYGISPRQVRNIAARRAWAHVRSDEDAS